MPLVKGSTIINSVLMCLMTNVLSLTHSLMAKYLMSMCLLRLQLLLFLAKKTAVELSQNTFSGLDIESMILSPEMKLFIHTSCDVALKQETNSASIVEVANKVCFALLHDTAPPAILIYVNQHSCQSLNLNNQLSLGCLFACI